MSLCLALMLFVGGYFDAYPKEAKFATDFIHEHAEIWTVLDETMDRKTAEMAVAIVAPEISQYSVVGNWAQQRTLSISYILYGRGDFSVGVFQMKPSFAEAIERIVASDTSLLRLHPLIPLPVDSDTGEMSLRERRHSRLERLASVEWQCRYLAAFISIAERSTAAMKFGDIGERLRYFATLYNAGIKLTEVQVKARQRRMQFPRFGNEKFNYADVAVEFYRRMK